MNQKKPDPPIKVKIPRRGVSGFTSMYSTEPEQTSSPNRNRNLERLSELREQGGDRKNSPLHNEFKTRVDREADIQLVVRRNRAAAALTGRRRSEDK